MIVIPIGSVFFVIIVLLVIYLIKRSAKKQWSEKLRTAKLFERTEKMMKKLTAKPKIGENIDSFFKTAPEAMNKFAQLGKAQNLSKLQKADLDYQQQQK